MKTAIIPCDRILMMVPMGRTRKLGRVSTKSLPASTNSTCFVFLLLNTITLKVVVVQACNAAFTRGLSMMIQTIHLQEMLTSYPVSVNKVEKIVPVSDL